MLRPFNRGFRVFREVLTNRKKEDVGWRNPYYAVTLLDDELINDRIHPNTGAPDYNVKHDLSDLTLKSHSSLDDLNWNDAGHTIDVDVDFDGNNIVGVDNIALTTISSRLGTSITVNLGADVGDDFIVGNNNALVVKGDTNRVGIGTDDPTDTLELRGDTGSAIKIKIRNDDTAGVTSVRFNESVTGRGEIWYHNNTNTFNVKAIEANSTLNLFGPANEGIAITATTTSIILGTDAGDDFIVGEAGSNLLVVEGDSGDIGIGTANPAGFISSRRTLHLEDTINGVEFRMVGPGGADFTCDVVAGVVQFGSRSNTTFRIITNGSGKMDILGSGLVIIGGGVPDAMLEIRTNAASEEGLHIKGSASQTGSLLILTDNSDNRFIDLGDGLANSIIDLNVQEADIDFRIRAVNNTNAVFVDGATGKVEIGIGSPSSLVIPLSVKEKAGLTSIGGYAIKLTNKTGVNSIAGQLVKADIATNDAVVLAGITDIECFGVFLDSDIANNAEAWVVVSGIADVAFDDNIEAVRGNWIGTGAAAGYARTQASPAAAPQHFEEIGHCIESVSAGGEGTHILARCILHFN